jgi:glutathione S-transferase
MANGIAIGLSRELKAPKDTVFNYFTKQELGSQWLRPDGFHFVELTMDATPGGNFGFHMKADDGSMEFHNSGEYLDIVENSRVIWTNSEQQGVKLDPILVVTVQLSETDGGTLVHIEHEGFQDEATRDEHAGGWNGCLDLLEKLVAS